MNKQDAKWRGPFGTAEKEVYQYRLGADSNAAIGMLTPGDDRLLGWVERLGLDSFVAHYDPTSGNMETTCGGFTTVTSAMDWVEELITSQPTPAEDIVNALLRDLHYRDTAESRQAIVAAVHRIEALTAPATTEAEAAESHQSITQFSGSISWTTSDADCDEAERTAMWLPSEPFGHISQNSLAALRDGVDVTILDLPTKDGIAIDAIIIEPKIKPSYGERDRKGFYVVPEDTDAGHD